jgi:phosphonate transport system substrate-binding protein
MSSHPTLLLILAGLAIAACSPGPDPGGQASPLAVPALPAEVIRLSFLPDDNVAAVEAVARSLSDYLQTAIGMQVRYERSVDYQACVTGLVANRLDLVWLGGVTFCQASERSGGQVAIVACRDIDLHFKSYFIANHEVVGDGRIAATADLARWNELPQRQALRGLTFTFGAKDSTSGHIMPRHFMLAAGILPEQAFAAAPQYQLLGGHAATFRAVASGLVDLGVMNYAVYEKQSAADRELAPVIYTTPTYVDYCFAAHRRLGDPIIARLRAALLALKADNPQHAGILQAWKCQEFVAPEAARWDTMAKVLAELPKDFLK